MSHKPFVRSMWTLYSPKMTSREFDYYLEMKKVKIYNRYIPGTVLLGVNLISATVLFVYRMFGVLLGSCSWAISDKYFVPPVQLIVYLLMVLYAPSEHIDTMCFFGQVMVPLFSFAYCAFMMYMSWKNSSPMELAFYCFLTLVQIGVMLPERVFGGKLLKPFLKRNEDEVEAERHEIIKKFQLPPQ